MTDQTDVFLIEGMEVDPMENNRSEAMRWVPIAFVLTEERAEQVVDEGGVVEGSGWPFSGKRDVFRYRKLSQFEFQDHEYPYIDSGHSLRECVECGLHNLAHPGVYWQDKGDDDE